MVQPADASSGVPSTSVTITAVDETGVPIQTPGQPARSRTDVSTARSAVFRILPDGGADVVWSSTSITAFAIAPALQPGSVLIGTSDKGRIYSVTNDGRDTLLLQSSEGQISSFYRVEIRSMPHPATREIISASGRNLSPKDRMNHHCDAKLTASWGRIWWRGNGNVELQTRTGNGGRPDATWSEWSSSYRDPEGSPISSPRARFVQWRATLRSGRQCKSDLDG